MKKQLLIGAFALASFFTAQAQVSYSFEESEGFTVGSLTVDEETGEGQNGWFAQNPFSEIISTDATDGSNSLFIGTSNVPQTNQFFAVSPTFNNVAGNIDFSYDVKISAFAEGASTFMVALESAADEMVTSRLLLTADGRWAYVNEDAEGELGYYYLGTIDGETFTPFIAEAGTWYNVRVEHNFADGFISFYVDDVLLGESVVWAASTADVFIAGSDNASSTITIDNVVIDGSETAGVNENILANLSVYPNPTSDVVNVSVDALVSNVAIADLNGRTVKTVKFDGVSNASVNVSDLASGVYMMTVSSDKGTTTKKIVKN